MAKCDYSAQENWVRFGASINLEIVVQSDGRRIVLIRHSFDATFLECQLVVPQFIHLLVATFANSESGNLPTVPLFDDFLYCMDGCVDAECA